MVRKVDFLPNRVFAFSPGQESWHGVEKFDTGGKARHTLQVFIVMPKSPAKNERLCHLLEQLSRYLMGLRDKMDKAEVHSMALYCFDVVFLPLINYLNITTSRMCKTYER